MPSPDRTTITKDGRVPRTGYTNMLERMTYGTPQRQHIQLQMLKGLWKTEICRYDATWVCRSGDRCCFQHRVDNGHNISQRVAPIRQEVFTKLYEQEFALPLEILHEINKLTDQEYDIRRG